MADEIDVANSIVEGQIESALRRIRESSGFNKPGSEFCIECGEDMPPARQKLGFSLCVPCAQESERRKSLFATD